MNCEEMLSEQALLTKKHMKHDGHVWVYRNSVKALPWFSIVREKLENQRYWGYFLPIANCTDGKGIYFCGDTATDNLYHDFLQTPTTNYSSTGVVDCGVGIECGEYLFDHRNKSLSRWLTTDYILGPSALGVYTFIYVSTCKIISFLYIIFVSLFIYMQLSLSLSLSLSFSL